MSMEGVHEEELAANGQFSRKNQQKRKKRNWNLSQNLTKSSVLRTSSFYLSEDNLKYPVSRMIRTINV